MEVAGVYSQAIFGAYQYGPTLGPGYWEVPFAMGINWLVLIYTSRIAAQRLSKNPLIISFISALLMVAIDFIIEPVAIFMDLWNWKGNIIPIQNYLAWFIASFFIQLLYVNIEKKTQNSIAIPVLLIQTIFFGLLHAYLLLK